MKKSLAQFEALEYSLLNAIYTNHKPKERDVLIVRLREVRKAIAALREGRQK